ncbi:RluA family pseudouridine synthase [Candidatus Gracilibacteria bacterium]|nr:RluA family pseudouridine synthase [Candidatus Gracilibacteria bacterium]NUJ98344.1 RluA family pseudouridine synthase [Candidatus Gracilibacteria bacterium]NUJ99301.1 RluA family pseudouridine synthase [Candidatus Gracilibacteria bacterium]
MKILFCTYIEKRQRVDIYLSALFGEFSRSYIQKIIDRGEVKINNEIISKNIKINPKDEIEMNLEIEKSILIAEEIMLDIIYEDENIILINKDAGVNVHPVPGEDGKTGTLVNALLYHCKEKLPTINGTERPGIVHRLDKDTSGIIMIAKNDMMMKYLQEIIKKRKIQKYYLTIVKGKIKEKNFSIESYIGRHPTDKIKMTTKNPLNPKLAYTSGELLTYIDDEFSLLKIKIETGRTHQIRVHLASIGFPIIGDKVYGDKEINKLVEKKYGLTRQALHAYELGFELYGKDTFFQANLKEDMEKIIGDIEL